MNNYREICNRDWVTDDSRFVFDFHVLREEEAQRLKVKVELYYTALIAPHRVLLWKNEGLPIDEEIALKQLKVLDGFKIEGNIKWYLDTRSGNDLIIWANLDFGNASNPYEFTGPIFVEELGHASSIPIDPTPPFDRGSDNPPECMPIITPDRYEDLFPYVYMNNWPELDETQITHQFVQYNLVAPNPFYSALKTAKSAQNRADLETEAVKYIEGKADYKGKFIHSHKELTGAISRFCQAVDEFKDQHPVENVVEFLINVLDTTIPKFKKYLAGSAYSGFKERLWDTYFSLIVELGYKFKLLDYITEVLISVNFVEEVFSNLDNDNKCNLSEHQLKEIASATIILPIDIFPMPPYPAANNEDRAAETNWIEPYAIGNLQLVRQRLLRYESGEIANVISVLPGEKKEIVKRKLLRTNEQSEESSQQISEKDSNTDETTGDLSSEVNTTLAERTDTYTYTDFKSKYGAPSDITINGNWSVKKTVAEPDLKTEVSFAKNILNRTARRMSDAVSRKRLYSSMDESEETTVSVFDNTDKSIPINGRYYWLNKVYEARVINYGNRLMLSFMIKDPAAPLITKEQFYDDANLTEPLSPAEHCSIKDFKDITVDNYLTASSYYCVENVEIPPKETIVVSGSLEGNESKFVTIPEGYQAQTAYLSFAAVGSSNDIKGLIGRNPFTFLGSEMDSDPPVQTFTLSDEQGSLVISSVYESTLESVPATEGQFRIVVEVECACTPELLSDWQIKMYNRIMEAYDQKKGAYFGQLNFSNNRGSSVNNPLTDRMTVQTELKKACIKELINQMVSKRGVAPESGSPDQPSIYEVNKPRYTQFINYALEWNEMTYWLLEDFGVGSDFAELTAIRSGEDDFYTAFLQAEAARIIVPVRPEYNHRLLYYLEAGMLWLGRDNLVPALTEQTTLISELKKVFGTDHIKEENREAWEVVVPTSLQVFE